MCNKYLRFLVWLMPLSFFAYQFILRLWPSLTMQDMMQHFSVNATDYGLLASFYYYGYALTQIPIAIALDRYGSRFVLVSCALLCSLGMFITTYVDNWSMVLFGRFIIGIGSAGGFLTTSKVISQYFSPESYGRMVGFSFSIGLLGGVYGGKPMNLLLQEFGWKEVGGFLCVIAGCIGFLSYFLLRKKHSTESFQFSDIGGVIKSPHLITLAIVNLLLVGSLEGFADVWGVNYLVSVYSIDKSTAAEIVSFILIGMLFGGPILTFISKYLNEYRTICLAGICMALFILYLLHIPGSFHSLSLKAIFFCIGIMCCYQVLVFTVGSKVSSPTTLSITIAFLNCVNMLGGAFFHSSIGIFMDLFSSQKIINGMYEASAYQSALLVIPACALLGSLLTFTLRLKK